MSVKRSELDRRRERLSAAQREILARRLRGDKSAPRDTAPIPRCGPSAAIPLSFSQEGLFVLEQLSPGLPEYNEPLVLRMRGALDQSQLASSLDNIIVRHRVLRTRLVSANGVACQVIDEPRSGTLRFVDLCDLPDSQRFPRALAMAIEQAKQPFNFVTGPLLSAVLYRLAPADHLLALVIHHAIFDGWSIGVLIHELAGGYNSRIAHADSTRDELPIQYEDFSVWQRSLADRGAFDADLAFWKEKLRTPPPELPFLNAQSEKSLSQSSGAVCASLLAPDVVSVLQSFCREKRITPYAALLAAWNSLLFRYSGEQDILVGSATAGRDHIDLEPLIGYFVNTILLRTQVSGDLSFADLVSRSSACSLEALDHRRLPFETLVRHISPERTSARVPLVQTMFIVQNAPTTGAEFDQITFEHIAIHNGTAKFPLTLMAFEETAGIRLELEYETATFDPEFARRILVHFERLLTDGLANPDKLIADLAMLTPEEEHQLRVEWNATSRDYPRDASVIQLFEAQVASSPEAPATLYNHVHTTYGELNAKANQLGHYLTAHRVTPGSIVAVCMERSTDLVTAILGILKAGCAYLPLDPNVPSARICEVLADAQPSLLLVSGDTASAGEGGITRVVNLDTRASEIRSQSRDNPSPVHSNGSSLAYVIYTSGSTGRPKGVCVQHRAILRLLLNTNYISIAPADRIAQVSSMGFDAATFELWGALLHGACLVGISRDVLLSPVDLKECLLRDRIDVMWATVGVFNRIVGVNPCTFESVGTLLSGGDALSPKWVRHMLESGPPKRFLNGYGPTECTTFATCHPVGELAPGAASVPIGQPISNTTAYVLGRDMLLLPVGVPGELYIGGDGLATGYLGDPDLTAQRFVPNPFGNQTNDRLFRTGDLVKRNFDGNIEFLGRVDEQVKIRGFRIELQEVENAIRESSGVKDAAVIVKSDADGGKELVAYFVCRDGENTDTNRIKRYLSDRLPEYMVPALYVRLMDLPLNANGKIDKRNLPEPQRDRSEFGGSYDAPATDAEKKLAALWSELLGKSDLSRSDNFFDIGGNSLLVIQLQSRIEAVFDVRCSVRDLFEQPRLDRQAEHIGQISTDGAHTFVASTETHFMVPVRSEGTRRPLFFVTGAGDVVGTYGTLVGLLDWEQPFYGFPDPMYTDLHAADISVERLAEIYLREIRAKQPAGPYLLGGYSFGGVVAFEIARRLREAGDEVSRLIVIDTRPRVARRKGEFNLLHGFGQRLRYLRSTLSILIRRRRTLLQDFRILFGSAGRSQIRVTPRDPGAPSFRDYLRWSLRDIRQQDSEGLPEQSSMDARIARLRMLEVPHFFRHHQSMGVALRAYRNYAFPTYPGRMTLVHAEDGALEPHPADPAFGWGVIALGGVDVHSVPGTHVSMFRRPHVEALARIIQTCLD